MKPKRYLTLFLSTLLLVCVLAGCAPNVEHRFDTTEYSAQAEATMRSISQQLARMDSLLASHTRPTHEKTGELPQGKDHHKSSGVFYEPS